MYRYDEHDQRLIEERVSEFRQQTRRYLDGELNEDDEEMPMIQCIFTVNDKLPLSDAEPAPQKVAAPIASADEPGPSQGYTNPKRVVKSTAAPKPL